MFVHYSFMTNIHFCATNVYLLCLYHSLLSSFIFIVSVQYCFMTHIHFYTTNVYLPCVCDSLRLNIILMLIEQFLTFICNIE